MAADTGTPGIWDLCHFFPTAVERRRALFRTLAVHMLCERATRRSRRSPGRRGVSRVSSARRGVSSATRKAQGARRGVSSARRGASSEARCVQREVRRVVSSAGAGAGRSRPVGAGERPEYAQTNG